MPQWYKVRPKGRLAAWCKSNPTPSLRKQVISAAEWIFYDAPHTYLGWHETQNVFYGSTVVDPNAKMHPTEKPLWLMGKIMKIWGAGIVLDPFMGSGTTLVAAKDNGLKAIGIELDEAHCETAANRLSQEVLAL